MVIMMYQTALLAHQENRDDVIHMYLSGTRKEINKTEYSIIKAP